MPTYRQNVTNRKQQQVEDAEFDGGAAVFDDQKTRIVAGARGGAPRVDSPSGVAGNDDGAAGGAGVMMPHDDRPGIFMGDKVGRAG